MEVVISDRLFSYSFVDGKIESDMIKYIYILVKEEGTKMDDTNLSIVKVDNIKKFWLSLHGSKMSYQEQEF